MIIDRMAHAERYKGISPWLDKALDFMLEADLTAFEDGRYEVEGEHVYFMVQSPALKALKDTKWEIHRRYIDIQIGLTDGENIGYAPVSDIDGWEAYQEEKDVSLSYDAVPGTVFPLRADTFVILFPQDAHRPCERAGKADTGRKVVFKVQV